MQNDTARIAARDTAGAQARYLRETMELDRKPGIKLRPWPKRKKPIRGAGNKRTVQAMLKRVGL